MFEAPIFLIKVEIGAHFSKIVYLELMFYASLPNLQRLKSKSSENSIK